MRHAAIASRREHRETVGIFILPHVGFGAAESVTNAESNGEETSLVAAGVSHDKLRGCNQNGRKLSSHAPPDPPPPPTSHPAPLQTRQVVGSVSNGMVWDGDLIVDSLHLRHVIPGDTPRKSLAPPPHRVDGKPFGFEGTPPPESYPGSIFWVRC